MAKRSWRELRVRAAAGVPVLLAGLIVGCGEDDARQAQIPALAGEWRGRSQDGSQLLWVGLWADRRYEWRQGKSTDKSPVLGHAGRWKVATPAGGPAGEQVIALTCEGAHPESPKPVSPGEYEVRFVPKKGAPGFVIQSPWGQFTATRDEGA